MNKVVLLLLVVFVKSLMALPEFVPMQEKAQGYSLAAGNLLNDSLLSNPASSSFVQSYSIEAIYEMPRNFAVSVLDTKTSDFGAGLMYFRKQNPEFLSEYEQGVRVGVSGKISEMIGVGATGKVLWGVPVNGPSQNFKDVDLGILVNFDLIQLGINARNLGGGNTFFKQSRETVVGARLNYQQTVFLNVSAYDTWGRFNPYQYGIGAEYVSPYYFSIKGGLRIIPESSNQIWSAGLSLLAPHLGIHYAVEFPHQTLETVEHLFSLMLLM